MMSEHEDKILTALKEAAVEVRFRHEDAVKRQEQPHPIVAESVMRTLVKIREAIKLREAELGGTLQ
jgi:hypothetical protein